MKFIIICLICHYRMDEKTVGSTGESWYCIICGADESGLEVYNTVCYNRRQENLTW